MSVSKLEEKAKNNCEIIWHVQKKVVSLHRQTKEIKNKTKTKKVMIAKGTQEYKMAAEFAKKLNH